MKKSMRMFVVILLVVMVFSTVAVITPVVEATDRIWFEVGYRRPGEEWGARNPFLGALIDIYRDNILIRTLTTNAEGLAEMHMTIPPGTYLIARIRVPNGWRLLEEYGPGEFRITGSGRGAFF